MSSENHTIRTNANAAPVNELQNKSNTELLEEIEQMLAQGLDMDTDKLEQYLATLQERAPVMTDYDPDQAWEQLQSSHPLLFEEEQSAGNTKPQHSKKDTSARKLHWNKFLRALEVAALLSLFFMITANAAGFNPIRAILNWADEIIQVYQNPSGIMELPADDPSEFHTLEAALIADGIDTEFLPRWVPKDYSLRLINTRYTDDSTKYSAFYQSDRGDLMIRVADYYNPSWADIEERENGGTEYVLNGIEFYLVSNYEQCKAGWQIGRYSYVIRGQVTEEEIKVMIDSIKQEQ